MPPKLSPAGDRAFLADLGDASADEIHGSAAAVRVVPGVLTCIVGQRSLYVVFDHRVQPGDEIAIGQAFSRAPQLRTPSRKHSLEVSFAPEDAPDLPELLELWSIPRAVFLDRIRQIRLIARYLGFRAGFAYLDGWPVEWAMPRRPTSRPRVARGSFAIAASTAGFYAVNSPGGWNVIGRTAAPLWDPRRDPPNMLASGDEISIIPVDGLIALPPENSEVLPSPGIEGMEIVGNAPFVTLVRPADWKRIDHGMPPGGAFDEAAASEARRLAGADAAAPVFECALVGPRVRFHAARVIAWTGASSNLPKGTPVAVNPGDEIDVGPIRGGLRGWLAIGDEGESSGLAPDGGLRASEERLVIRVAAGPHDTPLREIACEVTPQLNRVGIRMRPLQPVGFDPPADLPSCGIQFGTIQLHPDGTLVAMGPDHPITGGYLQPLTVLWNERWKLAQLAPGERVKFVC
jgi:KipI family sensor histidine kinase inhibitor